MTLGEMHDARALRDRAFRVRLLVIKDLSNEVEPMLTKLKEELPHAEVRVEHSLDAAMAHLDGHPVDVVLVDLPVPDVLGDRGLHALRAAHPETTLMVVTGPLDGHPAFWVLADAALPPEPQREQDHAGVTKALVRALYREHAEEEADRSLQLARGVLDAVEGPTCAVDSDSRIVAVNRAWREFTANNAGTAEQCGVGVSYLDTCDSAAADAGGSGAAAAGFVAQGIRQVLAGSLDHFGYEYPCHSPSESRWFRAQLAPAVINGGNGAVISHLDITAMHEMQRAVAHQSLHDSLTDLPNGLLMFDRIEQAAVHADRCGAGLALTHLDLHSHPQLNDRLGYRDGEALLVQVAERLQGQLRASDTLSRSSGTGFLVLWHDVDHPDAAVELSEGLVRALQRPFDLAGGPVSISASAGVAFYTPGRGVEGLLQSAEAALEDARSRGPGHVVLLTDELREATTFRRSLEADLRGALEGVVTQLVLHYQPIVNLRSGKVVAVEALARWQHPALGLLGPDRFIPLAEATGLIHLLGDWVLDQAIRDTASLTHQGRELDLAVNFSVRQLNSDMIEKVQGALERGGLRPGRLTLEVTESALVEDEETTAATLDAASRLGVKIAIDDFGTGYSSLLYLRRYPVDTLKIDREFVAGIGKNADDEAICGSITNLAGGVGASTVGEGVETMEQYAFLRSLGCLHGQGFLWSPGVPIDNLAAALVSCDEVPVAVAYSPTARPSTGQGPQVAALISKMYAQRAPLHTIATALNRTLGSRRKGAGWTAGEVAQVLPTTGLHSGTTGLGAKQHVLLCHDVESTRRMLCADLELAGFEVEEASDGRAAMARLIQPDAATFAVVVLDCQVSPFDGWWAIAAIRAHRRLDDVPVLLVTDGVSDHSSYEDNTGGDVIVAGPLAPDAVVEAVARLALTEDRRPENSRRTGVRAG